MKMSYSDDKGRISIEVRMHDGVNAEGTAYGTILRKPTLNEAWTRATVSVGGRRVEVHDLHNLAHVYVTEFPRDMDEEGYG